MERKTKWLNKSEYTLGTLGKKNSTVFSNVLIKENILNLTTMCITKHSIQTVETTRVNHWRVIGLGAWG